MSSHLSMSVHHTSCHDTVYNMVFRHPNAYVRIEILINCIVLIILKIRPRDLPAAARSLKSFSPTAKIDGPKSESGTCQVIHARCAPPIPSPHGLTYVYFIQHSLSCALRLPAIYISPPSSNAAPKYIDAVYH